MSDSSGLVTRLPNDIGGKNGGPFVPSEHPLQPWEKRCHALAEKARQKILVNSECYAFWPMRPFQPV